MGLPLLTWPEACTEVGLWRNWPFVFMLDCMNCLAWKRKKRDVVLSLAWRSTPGTFTLLEQDGFQPLSVFHWTVVTSTKQSTGKQLVGTKSVFIFYFFGANLQEVGEGLALPKPRKQFYSLAYSVICLFIGVCVCVWDRQTDNMGKDMWRSKDNLVELVFSHIYVGFRNQTQVTKLVRQAVCPTEPSCWPPVSYERNKHPYVKQQQRQPR